MKRTIVFKDKIEEHQLAEKVDHKYGSDALRRDQYIKFEKQNPTILRHSNSLLHDT